MPGQQCASKVALCDAAALIRRMIAPGTRRCAELLFNRHTISARICAGMAVIEPAHEFPTRLELQFEVDRIWGESSALASNVDTTSVTT